jgi:intron-binding protein aquarius
VELLVDLESQLPTRRYFNTLLDDHHVVVACQYVGYMPAVAAHACAFD